MEIPKKNLRFITLLSIIRTELPGVLKRTQAVTQCQRFVSEICFKICVGSGLERIEVSNDSLDRCITVSRPRYNIKRKSVY